MGNHTCRVLGVVKTCEHNFAMNWLAAQGVLVVCIPYQSRGRQSSPSSAILLLSSLSWIIFFLLSSALGHSVRERSVDDDSCNTLIEGSEVVSRAL